MIMSWYLIGVKQSKSFEFQSTLYRQWCLNYLFSFATLASTDWCLFHCFEYECQILAEFSRTVLYVASTWIEMKWQLRLVVYMAYFFCNKIVFFSQKAKKKPMKKVTAKDLGIDLSPRIKVLSVEDPPVRQAGSIIPDVDTLVAKLKEGGHV